MKTLISLLFLAVTVQAEEPAVILNVKKLSCHVPIQDTVPRVQLDISLANDTSVDFITLNLSGPNLKETLFIQMEKGSLEKQLTAGTLGLLVLQEGASQENGVIKKSGFLALSKAETEEFTGMLAALGNIYPLICVAVK